MTPLNSIRVNVVCSGARRALRRVAPILSVFTCLTMSAGTAAHAAASVYLDDLTWTEVRDDLVAGSTTVLIPVGGSEQSGPHMALGKHNVRARLLAGRIATTLGNTLVAPVVNYVPEGSITPPAAHMRYAGTLSIGELAFKGIIEGAARSLRQHGFRHIVLLGDHGGYQAQLKAVAAALNHEWGGAPAHVSYIEAYYRAAAVDYPQALREKGFDDAQIGTHAGLADTALMLALDPALVRSGAMHDDASVNANGVAGDPRKASAALGEIGVEFIVRQSVAAIRQAAAARH